MSAKTVVSSTATAGIRGSGGSANFDGGPGAVVDTAGWDTGLVEEVPGTFIGEATLSLEAAVTVKASAVLSLVCSDPTSDPSGETLKAAASQIVAVETTKNM